MTHLKFHRVIASVLTPYPPQITHPSQPFNAIEKFKVKLTSLTQLILSDFFQTFHSIFQSIQSINLQVFSTYQKSIENYIIISV
jgi:hypothetical protein